jgi:hypothetical protein
MLVDGPGIGSGLPRLARVFLRKEKRPLPNPRASDVEEYCNYNHVQPSTNVARPGRHVPSLGWGRVK